MLRPTAKLKSKAAPATGGTPSSASKPPKASAPLTPGPSGSLGTKALPPPPGRAGAVANTGSGSAPLPPARPPPLRQQIEAYFSDEGLRQDRHVHDLVAESPEGWVDVSTVLGLRKVKALRARQEDVLRCLHGSWLETWHDKDSGTAAIRRPPHYVLEKEEPDKPKAPSPAASLRSSVRAPAPPAKPSSVRPVRPGSAQRIGSGAAQPVRIPAQRIGSGAAQPANEKGRQLLPGRLTGVVSSYDESSGEASISCAQTEALFQRDVAIDWRELERGGVAINIGSLVSFMVELATDGAPQARDLELRVPQDCDEEAATARAVVAAARRARQPPGKPKLGKAGAKAVVGQRYNGTIKSFHEGIGVGFVKCKETFASFGRDVSLSADECAGFALGDAVSFVLALDADMGTPKAHELEAAEGVEAEDLAAGGEGGAWEAEDENEAEVNDGEDAEPAPPIPAKRKAPGPAERRFSGVIKSFSAALGLGRIACDSMSQLLPVEEAELASFAVGDAVSFRIDIDEFGKRKAADLEAE